MILLNIQLMCDDCGTSSARTLVLNARIDQGQELLNKAERAGWLLQSPNCYCPDCKGSLQDAQNKSRELSETPAQRDQRLLRESGQ